eukprot:477723-Prorocentrum_minimum.AAC.3
MIDPTSMRRNPSKSSDSRGRSRGRSRNGPHRPLIGPSSAPHRHLLVTYSDSSSNVAAWIWKSKSEKASPPSTMAKRLRARSARYARSGSE